MTYAAALYLTLSNALFFPSSTDTDTDPGPNTDTDRTDCADRADRAYSRDAHTILDELVLSGNRVAAARKRELIGIEALFDEFARRVQREGLRLLTLSSSGSDQAAGLSDATATQVNVNGNLNVDVDVNNTPVGMRAGEVGLGTAGALQVSSSSNTTTSATATLFHGPGHGIGPVDPVDSAAPAPAPASVEFLESIGISSYEFLSIVEQIDHPEIWNGELDVRPDLLGAGDGTGSFG